MSLAQYAPRYNLVIMISTLENMIMMDPNTMSGPAVITWSQDLASNPPASQNNISLTEFESFSSTTMADISELKNADTATPDSSKAGMER